jgi:hypothetical protein
MNSLTDENVIKIISEIMSLQETQHAFSASKLNINKQNDCWWLLSYADSVNPIGSGHADYLGTTRDADNVEIIAVLMLDRNEFPIDFEIIKLDGEEIISSLSDLKFLYKLDVPDDDFPAS